MGIKKITIEFDDNWDQGYQEFNIPGTTGYDRNRQYNDPCRFCSNNPAVNPHASGFCNCALPALMNPMF